MASMAPASSKTLTPKSPVSLPNTTVLGIEVLITMAAMPLQIPMQLSCLLHHIGLSSFQVTAASHSYLPLS